MAGNDTDGPDGDGNGIDSDGDDVDSDGPIQFAAGGLLRRADGHVAVVHRPRYDDWSLPKGKVEAGERLDETAAREVREETGCTVEVGPFAGRYAYDADGPKAVLIWHMTVDEGGAGAFRPGDEVDELAWLTVDAALDRLSYPNERALVRRAVEGASEAGDDHSEADG